ncbi:MAG: 3-methyl-2-oxobutanoate hydroxymethyltransferase [Myxococcales bacterium]|nr:3-methyl-2-oxobutanoate hydroxymethyltransferase [Myxococcota bacterium]MDW8283938.1 3-methyl-2-oxobutanoate hydroxymethyltransferase [Myxococcales bacterium]
MADPSRRRGKVTHLTLREMKRRGERIAMLTAYDASFARLCDQAGVDVLLVGDSLGMVIQGMDNTLSVTMDQMIYHCQAVARGVAAASGRAMIVADMPFLSYQASREEAVRNAGRLVKEGHAEAVKLEGGAEWADLARRLSRLGVPVMGHIGLTPQSVHTLGGFRVQGRGEEQSRQLLDDARALEEAGCFAIVLEAIPKELAAEITAALTIPTLGIGAGPDCDGQVLVLYDLLGMNEEFRPRFVKRYENLAVRVRSAVGNYIDEVRTGQFPGPEHSFSRDSAAASGAGVRAAAGGGEADLPIEDAGVGCVPRCPIVPIRPIQPARAG